MVDATLIQASGSTRNKARQRDPEMRSTRKGGQYYFGMKMHIGADVNRGAAHEVAVTAANEADIGQLPNLLRADDEAVFGDAGYASDRDKRGARALGWYVHDKPACCRQAQAGAGQFERLTEKAQPASLAGQGAAGAFI